MLKGNDVKFPAEEVSIDASITFFFVNLDSFYVPELIEIQGDWSCHNQKDLEHYRLSGFAPEVSKVFLIHLLWIISEILQWNIQLLPFEHGSVTSFDF